MTQCPGKHVWPGACFPQENSSEPGQYDYKGITYSCAVECGLAFQPSDDATPRRALTRWARDKRAADQQESSDTTTTLRYRTLHHQHTPPRPRMASTIPPALGSTFTISSDDANG